MCPSPVERMAKHHVPSTFQSAYSVQNHFESLVSVLQVRSAMNDEQTLRQVRQVLDRGGYVQLRSVRAYCDHGRITLQGRVTTYFLKQVAQELVRSVSDVRDIDNDLRVVCPG